MHARNIYTVVRKGREREMHIETEEKRCILNQSDVSFECATIISKKNANNQICSFTKRNHIFISFEQLKFSSQYALDNRTMHKEFQCDICKKRFTRKDNMRVHILQKHVGQKKTCKFCGMKLGFTSLSRHINTACKGKNRKQEEKSIQVAAASTVVNSESVNLVQYLEGEDVFIGLPLEEQIEEIFDINDFLIFNN